jgi:hypothetical protein
MNTITWIILGVVIFIFVYIVYLYWTSNVLSITILDLNKTNPPVPSTNVKGSTNANYTYSTWVWVNSWNVSVPHCIVSAPPGSSNPPPATYENGQKYDFALYMDKNSPTLYCSIGSSPNDQSNTITITNNFPLQSWVYVVVTVQTNVVDCYLNGKLIVSQQINQNGTPLVTPSFTNIYLGNNSGSGSGNGWDCQLMLFKWMPTIVTPQQVWNSYLSGNGQSMFPSLTSYGLQLDLTQNNQVTSSYTLF